MNDFFTNLIGRHLGTCDTVQPRTPGRFEVDRCGVAVGSPDESTNLVETESHQTLQSPGEAPFKRSKIIASEINPLLSTNVESVRLTDLRSAVSVEARKVTVHEPEPIGNKSSYSFPSLPDQGDSKVQQGLNVQPVAPTDEPVLPGKPYDTQPLDPVRISGLKVLEQEQSNRTVLAADEHDLLNDGHVQINNNAPALDPAVTSLEPTPVLEKQAESLDGLSTDDGKSSDLIGRLEVPSWIPDIEAQFSQRLQEIEASAEPVINVTIGRVEVRALQTEAPKNSQQPEKPTGVMTLDEYLKRREGRLSG